MNNVFMKNSKITYVFGSGRLNRLSNKTFEAREFFYSYFYFLEKYKNIEIIEMLPEKPKVYGIKKILRFIDKVLRKISNLPFYTTEICSFKNLKVLLKTEKLIITNDRLGISLLPLLIVAKTINKKLEIFIIIIFLFSKNKKNKLVYFFQTIFTKLLIFLSKKLIFLGKGEFYKANNLESKNNCRKFEFLPFSIDFNFWSTQTRDAKNFSQILFIGNDGNRDYKFLIELAKNLTNYNFIFISKNLSDFVIPKNVKLLQGSWNEYEITDSEIREIYKTSFVTINPILETLQPSGQSVTLQSMASGTPVIITRTEGFWDKENFIDNMNILFVEKNNIEEWTKKINNLSTNKELFNKLSESSQNLVENYYSLKTFNTRIEKIIF